MAVGKNKRLTKSKKGGKKKATDPFLKKEWYEVKAPSMFSVRNAGKTLVTRTQGTKVASDALKGRVFDLSLADLNNDEDQTYRKIKLVCEDIQGYNCLTNFHGMDMTRDKLASLIKKWQTLIEGNVDVKTTDGYTLRMFCIAFTTKMPNQLAKLCYANSAQVRAIRKKMVEIMRDEATKCDLKELVLKLIPEYMGTEIEKACAGIFPLQNVFVRKVKVLKKPKFDLVKLMELHGDAAGREDGRRAGRPRLVQARRARLRRAEHAPQQVLRGWREGAAADGHLYQGAARDRAARRVQGYDLARRVPRVGEARLGVPVRAAVEGEGEVAAAALYLLHCNGRGVAHV